MQIREQDQTRTKKAVLGRLRLFDLHDQVRAGPDIRSAGDDFRSRVLVFHVRDRTAFSRAGLDQDVMPGLMQRDNAAGNQADPGLVILHLLRNADDHSEPLGTRRGLRVPLGT